MLLRVSLTSIFYGNRRKSSRSLTNLVPYHTCSTFDQAITFSSRLVHIFSSYHRLCAPSLILSHPLFDPLFDSLSLIKLDSHRLQRSKELP